MLQKPALLMLDDGVCFEGLACGAAGEAVGEAVFTTGMSGYQETLTDPSFMGQIIVFTAAHLGNYGVGPYDDVSFPHWRAAASLNDKLREAGVTGIHGVDTRALTLHLRRHGARNGIISALDLDKPSLLRRARALPCMQGLDLASGAGTGVSYAFVPQPPPAMPPLPRVLAGAGRRIKVAVLDFGLKRSILAHLHVNGMEARVWPGATEAGDILASGAEGVLLSNGPGDPEPCTGAVRTIRGLLGRLPIFGICLGHQLLALAQGGRTYKLTFGHHGMNHPVRDERLGRVCITSQNHGFNVDPDSLPAHVRPTHWNLNDDTLEGMASERVPAFSVQYHPETAPGTWDAHYLFARFRDLILEAQGGRPAGRGHA